MCLGVVVASCFVSQSFSALSPFVSVDCAVSTVSAIFLLGDWSFSLVSFLNDLFGWGFLWLDGLVD